MYLQKEEGMLDPWTMPMYCGLAGAPGTGKSRILIKVVNKVRKRFKEVYKDGNFVLVPIMVTYNSGMDLTSEEYDNIEFYSALRVILS